MKWLISKCLGRSVALQIVFCLAANAAELVPIPELGLRVSRGFRVTFFADADLANDIYAMTLDANGNPVVTSRGYIRTLFDTDGNGRADGARDFAPTDTGGMGMCFHGTDLYFVGDGGLWRFRDGNEDGVADGGAEKLLELNHAEHGGHAVRKGPDGWWYVIAGNETRFTNQHVALPSTPVRTIQAGAMLRLQPDGAGAEALAHGFRNPYDFDFNFLGDAFTYDSDGEREFLLPWYMPTRLYHVAEAGHHGWLMGGFQRSWSRLGHFIDTVDVLAPIGRGSPTGLTVYRHYQFPPFYRNGIFFCDWTFGRVYFAPLQQAGASYATTPEIFLESIGTQGFAPTDVVVARDGALFVSIGGRKTRGGVYRIDFPAGAAAPVIATNWWLVANDVIEAVLSAPQPLEAWSRDYWEPMARRLGESVFAAAAADNRVVPSARIRAIEVLTEIFGGLSPDNAAAIARANAPAVRARLAWSLGRIPPPTFAAGLVGLSRDVDPLVRRCALEALLERFPEAGEAAVLQALSANLRHPDKRVRQLVARLATYLSVPGWQTFWNQAQAADPQSRLTAVLALLWREGSTESHPPRVNVVAVDGTLAALAQSSQPDLRLQALRLIVLGLGDCNVERPSVEAYAMYEAAGDLSSHTLLTTRIKEAVRKLFPSGDALLDTEAARLLAILEDEHPSLPGKVIAFLADNSSATTDFHFLTALSRLQSTTPTNLVPRLARAIVLMDRKLSGQEHRQKQNWTLRLAEVVQRLVLRNPALSRALVSEPDFVRPAHVSLAPLLEADQYRAAARLFFQAAQKDARFTWSAQLIDLLASLPSTEVFPLFRQQWSNLALRDELILKFAQKPEPVDRDKFIAGLASAQPAVIKASVSSLMQLPHPKGSSGRESALTVVAGLRLLRRLFAEPKARPLREEVLNLLSYQAGHSFKVVEQGADAGNLARVYEPVFAWFRQNHPAIAKQLAGEHEAGAANWNAVLATVPWERGNSLQGERIFRERGCQTCHATASQLGPDLSGGAARFSPTDLFYSIVFPNREVAPPYRTTIFKLRDGSTYTGTIIYESADGYIVQTAPDSTVRLSALDIVSQQKSEMSLMPSGLLDGLRAQDLANLYAYLKQLGPR